MFDMRCREFITLLHRGLAARGARAAGGNLLAHRTSFRSREVMSDIAQPKRLVAVYAGAPAGQRYVSNQGMSLANAWIKPSDLKI